MADATGEKEPSSAPGMFCHQGQGHCFKVILCDGNTDTLECVYCEYTKEARCSFDEDFA